MRTTTTTAWTAALAIMSMRGPFTTAEAAPARQYEPKPERHFFPKHLRRGGYNHTSPAVESSSSSSVPPEPDFSSADISSSQPLITPDTSPSTNTRRTRSSTQSSQAYDAEALIESLIEDGRLPETTNAVVTTTLTLAYNGQRTATYTLTYTETSSPAPNEHPESAKSRPPVPLTTSSSVPAPVPVGTAPDTHHHKPKHGHEKATISTRGTSTKNVLHSLVPTSPFPLNGASASHPVIDSRTHRHHNATELASPPPPPPPASSMPPSSSDAGPLGGLTNSLLGQGTQHAPTKTPEAAPESSQPLPIPKVHGTNGLLGSTGGLAPLNQPQPTPPSQSYAPSWSYSSSSDAGLLVGLTTAVPNVLGTNKLTQDGKSTKTTDGGLLSDLGVTGVPTGTLPAQSVLPTGVIPGGKKKPHHKDTTKDSGPLGLTNSLSNVAGTATGLVGSLTNGVDSAKSHVTGVVGSLTDGVNTLKSQATPDLSSIVNSAKSGISYLAGTATNAVGTATGLVGTATSIVGTVASDATDSTGLVGTATNLVGTATNLAGTATNQVNSLTNTLGASVPSGGYTITGGGVTLTVPIPSSIATSVPITIPSQVTYPGTGTGNNGYTITVPSGVSSVLSSLSGGTTTAAETYPESASAYPTTDSTSIPLTGSTKLTVGATPSSYPANDSTAVPASTSTTVAIDTHTKAPQTIQPTGTNSLTSMTFPTSWKFAPTTWSTKTTGLSTATEGTSTAVTGLPTYMPRLVQPPNGLPDAPPNATLIQLGFNYGLNYPFVVGEPGSAGQIFQYLPQGIAYGLGISESLVKMNALMPYDTSSSLRYITTLAQAYIPSQFVETMEMSIHMPLSEIYSNPDAPVKTLMSMINPTIPILPGANVGGASSSIWGNPAATATSGPGAGAPIGGDSGSSNHVKPSTLGIGIGAVGGAAVYAAAMVYVARRYKQKRQGHQRASSVHTTGEMSQRSGGMAGFFMSGANGIGSGSGGRGSRTSAGSSNGRSVREQGISGPIMAENSLGWN